MGKNVLNLNKEKLRLGLFSGSIIGCIIIAISLCYEKKLVDLNPYILFSIIGPSLFMGFITKSYLINFFIVCLSTFIYYNVLSIFIWNVSKINKLIIVLCLILVHIFSAVLFFNKFKF